MQVRAKLRKKRKEEVSVIKVRWDWQRSRLLAAHKHALGLGHMFKQLLRVEAVWFALLL